MIKPYLITADRCIKPVSYKYNYTLYRGDINKRFAITSFQNFVTSGRAGLIKTWLNFQYNYSDNFVWEGEGDYYDYNGPIISASSEGNKIYEITYDETPETPIIIPT